MLPGNTLEGTELRTVRNNPYRTTTSLKPEISFANDILLKWILNSIWKHRGLQKNTRACDRLSTENLARVKVRGILKWISKC